MRILRLLLLVVALAAVGAGSALAKASLTVTSGPVALGETFTLEACGATLPTSISFEVSGPKKSGIHYFTAGEPVTDPGGCFTDDWTAWWGVAGDYQITSWYRSSKGTLSKGAVLKLTVAPAPA